LTDRARHPFQHIVLRLSWTAVAAHVGDEVVLRDEPIRGRVEPPILATPTLLRTNLVGTLLPKSAVEDEKLGEISDEVTDKVKEAGHEALERGKPVAQDAVVAVAETVQNRGQSEAQQMSESLQDNAQEISRSS
jgi:hypothetical protein